MEKTFPCRAKIYGVTKLAEVTKKHVIGSADANTGHHGLAVTSPVHMPRPTVTADLLDPHGVMVHNLSSLGGPLLTS